ARLTFAPARSAPSPPIRPGTPSRRRSHHRSLVPSSDRRREGYVALITVEEHLGLENVLIDDFRSEVSVDGECLESREGESGARFVVSCSVECRQQLGLLRRRKVD